MTDTSKGDRAALARLADALVEDILQSTDAQLLAEAQADGEVGAADSARTAFRRASALSGSSAQAGGRRRERANVRALDPGAARRWLEAYFARNPQAASELAPGASDEVGLSDEDVYGMLERLQECYAPERRDSRHDGR
jgi:hypothetical protein